MYNKLFLLLTFLNVCNGFTPIRSLVSAQAFTSSVLNTINREFILDNDLVKDVLQGQFHMAFDVFYILCLGSTCYLQFNLYVSKNNWDNIELYSSIRRRTNSLLTIIFILFIKDIDNAI